MGSLIGNELICFQNANLVAPKTYDLSNIIRGVRGTEWAISTHAVNSRFVLVKGGDDCIDIAGSLSQLGKTYTFKAVPSAVADTEVDLETTITVTGNRLKPYAPSNLKIDRTLNDLKLKWQRRTRKNGDWLSTTEIVPLNEDNEEYEIEILNGNTIVRTVTTTIPSYTYLEVDRTADGLAAATTLSLNLYQISTTIGRGNGLAVRDKAIDEIIF
jgi:hypothetical protein